MEAGHPDGPRGRWIGAAFGGVATAACAVLGSWGLPDAAGRPVGLLGLVVGVVITVVALRRVRAGPPAPGFAAAFRTRRYRVMLVLEIVAIAVGATVLRLVGLGELSGPWVVLVLGLHFIGFGDLFGDQRPLGWGLVGAALVGAPVGIEAGSGPGRAVAWLLAGCVFLAYAMRALLVAPRRGPASAA